MQTLIDKIEDKILETFIKAQGIYNMSFEIPKLEYNLTGFCAGQAWIDRLRFNMELCKTNESDFIAQTVPHEVAHYISRIMFGSYGMGHKKYWKDIMRALGCEPRRCHSYDCSTVVRKRRTVKRYPFSCDCNGYYMLSSIKANRYGSYTCRKCHSHLKPLSK